MVELSTSEWILNIDADEEISKELADEIIKIKIPENIFRSI